MTRTFHPVLIGFALLMGVSLAWAISPAQAAPAAFPWPDSAAHVWPRMSSFLSSEADQDPSGAELCTDAASLTECFVYYDHRVAPSCVWRTPTASWCWIEATIIPKRPRIASWTCRTFVREEVRGRPAHLHCK